jgi:hypothetical protein
MANWYYVDPKTSARRGPCDERGIRQGYIDGLISANTLVWREGLANWVPLRDALDLTAAPPLGEGRVPLPDGLRGWMLFDGVCTIIASLPLLLLLPWNIPLLIAGIALLCARSPLCRTPYVPEEMLPFLLRLRTVFCAVGWVYVVLLVLALALFLLGVHTAFVDFADIHSLQCGWLAGTP